MSANREINFKIVEREEFPYEDFKRDYQDLRLSAQDLKDKYDLSPGRYYTKSKQVQKETGFHRMKGHRGGKYGKYIKKVKDKYYVYRNLPNGTIRYCGTYSDLTTARIVRSYLIEHDWSTEAVNYCKQFYGDYDGGWKEPTTLRVEAIDKFDTFKEYFFDGEHTLQDILTELNFTKWQYRVCRDILLDEYPNLRKPPVHKKNKKKQFKIIEQSSSSIQKEEDEIYSEYLDLYLNTTDQIDTICRKLNMNPRSTIHQRIRKRLINEGHADGWSRRDYIKYGVWSV